ncbi:MAG: hypothetical protein RI893_1294 [Pseudomonadota bacterium]|jgi:fructokinase
MPVHGNKIAVFGEALFDHFPDGQQVLGGAPFNVAWHLQAFAQLPCFISRVGLDAAGDKFKQAMQSWGMAVENLQIDPAYPTGTVRVIIDDDEPRYEILANQAYDFIAMPLLGVQYSVIYHGTLALRSPVSKQALQVLTANHQGKVFIDVNLREPWWDRASVNRWLDQANWVKLNHEELKLLSSTPNTLPATMRLFLAKHELDVLVVTCGSRGALAINKTGDFIDVAPTLNLAIVDTVGAGDGFSAILLLGLQLGWSLQLTMERAQSFASAIITQRGGTVQDVNFYRPFLTAWNLD